MLLYVDMGDQKINSSAPINADGAVVHRARLTQADVADRTSDLKGSNDSVATSQPEVAPTHPTMPARTPHYVYVFLVTGQDTASVINALVWVMQRLPLRSRFGLDLS